MGDGKAVVLLSGGIDSATTMAIARSEGRSSFALTVDYGQRHGREVEAARRIAKSLGAVRHECLRIDLRSFGGSALTGDGEVPRDRTPDEIGRGIPPTYVPARNTILLSLGLAWAESIGASEIFFGANVQDFSGYPDCRPEFISAFEALTRVGTRRGVEGGDPFQIRAPLIEWSKAEIIRKGRALGVDFSLTWSCYDPDPDGKPCRKCDSCTIRRSGFAEAGMDDPLLR